MTSFYSRPRGHNSAAHWPSKDNDGKAVWGWQSADYGQPKAWGIGASEWSGDGTSQGASSGSSPHWGGSWSSEARPSPWGAPEASWKGPQSWYKTRANGAPKQSDGWGKRWPGAGEDGAATAEAEAKAPPRPPPLPPPPDAASVQRVLDELDGARRARTPEGGLDPALFCRAICMCSASGDYSKSLDLLEEMSDHGLEPDASAYQAAIEACERSGQPVERVWLLLVDMRSQGLDPGAPLPLATPDGIALHCHRAASSVDGLQHHAKTWLHTAPPQKAAHAMVRIASALRQRGALDQAIETSLRERVLCHITQALREPADPESHAATVLIDVPGLGSFTSDVLEELGLAGAGPEGWHTAARAELRRQELLRRWAAWGEAAGPGLAAWMAYEVSGGAGGERWDLSSDGECFGRAPPATDGTNLVLLPPLARGAGAGHAERRALLSLVERILGKFPAEGTEELRVEGAVMLYTLRPPSTASIYAMRQFLRLFPWVRLCVGHGVPDQPRAVERIGPEPPPPARQQQRNDSGDRPSWGKWGWSSPADAKDWGKGRENGSSSWQSNGEGGGKTAGGGGGWSRQEASLAATNGVQVNGATGNNQSGDPLAKTNGNWNRWS